MAKAGLLSERERLPTVSLVYLLLPRGYRDLLGVAREGGQLERAQEQPERFDGRRRAGLRQRHVPTSASSVS